MITRGWPDLVSNVTFKLVLVALALTAASLLLRNASVIGLHVPLDPNEGWNAYLSQAAIVGNPLYPHGLMINNYPPLSFFIIGMLSRVTGDAVVAGRLLSLTAFLAASSSIVVILREMGARVPQSIFGGLFFATGLLVSSDYVAMNDPQLTGHALQLAGLLVLLQIRRETILAALLMTAGLFIKHNLVVLPFSAALWLLLEDPRDGLRFLAAGLFFCVLGLIATKLTLSVDLISALTSPRRWAQGNFAVTSKQFLSWAGTAAIATAVLILRSPKNPEVRLTTLYSGAALIVGGIFAFGDGVDTNIFFDAVIALSLGTGLVLTHATPRATGPLALFAALPMFLYLASHARDGGFHYSEAFAREAPGDIDFLRARPGPALCEDLTLCYWADKDEPVDVFNLSEAIATGRRGDGDLARLFETQHFGSIVLSTLTPFALGPHLRGLMLAHYRVTHEDDNGIFLEPR